MKIVNNYSYIIHIKRFVLLCLFLPVAYLASGQVAGTPYGVTATRLTEPAGVNASNTDICSGTPITLSYTGGDGTTFVWYSGSCGGTKVGEGNNLPVSPAATTTYYGRWENGSNVSTCKSVTVTVSTNLVPGVQINGGTTVYTNSDITFTATPTNGGPSPAYQWKVDGTNSGTGATFTTKWTTTGSRAITCVMTSNATCVTTTTATSNSIAVAVSAATTDPASVSANNASICSGSSATLSYSGGSGATFQWYSGSCGGTKVGTGNDLSVKPTATTTYYGRWERGTESSTCKSVTVTVNANLTPSVTIAGNNSTYTNTDITFTATPTNGGPNPTYQWKVDGTNAATGATFTTKWTTTGSRAITCVMTSNATCVTSSTATSTAINVTVNAATTDPTSVSVNNASICSGSSATLSYSGGSGATFQWYSGSCGGTKVGTGSSLSVSPTSTTTYHGRWERGTQYSACKSVTVTVTPTVIPSVTIAGGTTTYLNTDITFTATPTNGGTSPTYQWKVDGANAGTNSATFTTRWSTTGNRVISCVMRSNALCLGESSTSSNDIILQVSDKSNDVCGCDAIINTEPDAAQRRVRLYATSGKKPQCQACFGITTAGRCVNWTWDDGWVRSGTISDGPATQGAGGCDEAREWITKVWLWSIKM